MTESNDGIVAQLKLLAKAVSDMKFGGTHYDYQDVLDKFTEIMEAHKPNENNLTAAIVALNETAKAQLDWFKSQSHCVTKTDLEKSTNRILDAISSGISPDALKQLSEKLKGPTDALEVAVDNAKPEGEK